MHGYHMIKWQHTADDNLAKCEFSIQSYFGSNCGRGDYLLGGHAICAIDLKYVAV